MPKLSETLARYLQAVTPLCTDPAELAATREAIEAFGASPDALELQSILEQRDVEGAQYRTLGTATSYVRPFWNTMYLGGRYPVPINSNPAVHLKDLPQRTTLGQCGVAGNLAAAMARWYVGMKTGRIEPDFNDKAKNVPACMEEYEVLFAEQRIPRQDIDELTVAAHSKHIAVVRGADIYRVDVIDDTGAVATADRLTEVLQALVESTPAPPAATTPRVGNLTSQERNWWAAEREELCRNPVCVGVDVYI